MNELFPIVKSLDSLYDAFYMAERRRYGGPKAKNVFVVKVCLAFI